MTNAFKEYVDRTAKEQGCSANQVRLALATKTKMSAQAMRNYYDGMPVGTLKTAMLLQIATGAKLKIDQLIHIDRDVRRSIRAALLEAGR
jgi:hypothetical protein